MSDVAAIWTQLATEQPNSEYETLDSASSLEIVTYMNQADATVPGSVAKALPKVAAAVDLIADHFQQGGRLFYIGAGTSGRLGVLDAAECPPTFGTHPQLVQAIIAGGGKAVHTAVEGAEDSFDLGRQELQVYNLQAQDVVVGIAASGRTPYVLGALTYAQEIGAGTVSLACNAEAKISPLADVAIEVVTGAEVLMGSTRLKAATAQKMVLNMLSTGAMVKMGKVFRNLMVDLNASNDKLLERSKRILMLSSGVTYDEAEKALSEAQGHVKTAILMIQKQVDAVKAAEMLQTAKGFLRAALELEA